MAARILRSTSIVATMAAFLLGLAQAAHAQSDAWSAVHDRVELGERMIVEVDGGPRQTGLLQTISPEGLTLMVAGHTTHVPVGSVKRLWKKGDSNLNGFLIGAGGAGAMAGAIVWGLCDSSYGSCDGSVAGIVAVYAALGGLVGLGLDALIDGKTLVYKRPAGVTIAPIVTPDRVGVQARLAW